MGLDENNKGFDWLTEIYLEYNNVVQQLTQEWEIIQPNRITDRCIDSSSN